VDRVHPSTGPIRHRPLPGDPEFGCRHGPTEARQGGNGQEHGEVWNRSHKHENRHQQHTSQNRQQVWRGSRASVRKDQSPSQERPDSHGSKYQPELTGHDPQMLQSDDRHQRRNRRDKQAKQQVSSQNNLQAGRVAYIPKRAGKRLKKILQMRIAANDPTLRQLANPRKPSGVKNLLKFR
jgi:U3 small nucleolar RNA-associated protein 14